MHDWKDWTDWKIGRIGRINPVERGHARKNTRNLLDKRDTLEIESKLEKSAQQKTY